MSYDDIRPIFEAKFNENLEFLLKSKEQIEEEESRAIALITETLAYKAAKRRRRLLYLLGSETVSVAAVVQADIPTTPVNVVAIMTTVAPVKVAISSTRKRRGVVIRDPEKESSTKTPTETTSKDKGK
nr:hypothetical protein [Tanacetum cinerariifolium]